MKALGLAVVLLAAAPAMAREPRVTVGLDLGGGYWFQNTAQFDLHLRVQFNFAHFFAIGLRPGLLMNVRPSVEIGIPADVYFRFMVSRLYFDLIGGLAVLFGNPLPLRAHAAGGLGVNITRNFALGVEGGWLQDGAQILLRFAFTF